MAREPPGARSPPQRRWPLRTWVVGDVTSGFGCGLLDPHARRLLRATQQFGVGFKFHASGLSTPLGRRGGTLLRLTGRAQRRGCAGKPIPAPAVLVSLFPSSVAVSKVHFRQRANAFGCLGRRPLLAKDHGRHHAGLCRSVGPAQVGPGHIRQINSSLKSCIFINFIEQCIHSLKHAKRNIAPTHV